MEKNILFQNKTKLKIDEKECFRRFCLVYRYLHNIIPKKDIPKIAKTLKINMSGYKNILQDRKEFLNLIDEIIARLYFHPTGNKDSLESYNNLKKKRIIDFYIQVICDIVFNRSFDLLKQLLGEEFFDTEEEINEIMTNEEDNENESSDEFDKDEEIFNLKVRLEKAEADIAKLEKKLKKSEDEREGNETKINSLNDNVTKLKDKVKELKPYKADYDNLKKENAEFQDIKQQYEKLQQEYADYKKQTEYFEKLKDLKNVLLLDIRPKKSCDFPYQHSVVDTNDIDYEMPEGKFTEVWYIKSKYNTLDLSAIYQLVEAKFGKVDYLNFSEEWLNKMGLERIK